MVLSQDDATTTSATEHNEIRYDYTVIQLASPQRAEGRFNLVFENNTPQARLETDTNTHGTTVHFRLE